MRVMNIKTTHVGALAIFLCGGYIIGFVTNAYDGLFWIDGLFHFIVGMFVGFVWLWVFERIFKQSIFSKPLLTSVSSLLVVWCVAVFWELFEKALRLHAENVATFLGFNAPVNDWISDVLYALLGAGGLFPP